MNNKIVDVHTLAQFWGVTPRTIQHYADASRYNPPLPREGKGLYDFIKAMKWMYQMQKDKIEKLQNDGDEKLSDLKYQQQIMVNKKEEINLKKLMYQYVDKKQVLITWTNLINIIKNNDTQLKFDLKRDLETITDEVEKGKIIEKLFTAKDRQLSKMQIEKYMVNEDAILEESEVV